MAKGHKISFIFLFLSLVNFCVTGNGMFFSNELLSLLYDYVYRCNIKKKIIPSM